MFKFSFRNSFFFLFLGLFIPFPAFADNLKVKSFGHSNFLIKGGGQTVLLNPFKSTGCASDLKEQKNLDYDFILSSSRLADEGYNPSNNLMFVDPGVYKFKETILTGIPIAHDRFQGRRFGMATVWIWEQNDFNIVHMGGAAGPININNQILLSRPDILFISIGGGDKSYNGKEAVEIINKLKPNIVVPVHFRNKEKIIQNCDFTNEDVFLKNISDFKIKYVRKNFELNPNKIPNKSILIIK